MLDVLWFLLVATVVAWFVRNHLKESPNRCIDATVRYNRQDLCPRCGRPDVVVVSASSTGALYGACKACDMEVLL